MGRGPTPFVQQAPPSQGEAVHPQVVVPPDGEARPPESRPLLHQDLRGNSVQVFSSEEREEQAFCCGMYT